MSDATPSAIATSGLLPQPFHPEKGHYCLISSSDALIESIVRAFPPPAEVASFSPDELLDHQHAISPRGEEVVRLARESDAVLVEWRLDLAPVINTLGFHLRVEPETPLIALCERGPEQQVAAMAAGCDAASALPLSPSLVQAIVLSHRRLVAAVRSADPTAAQRTGEQLIDEQTFGPLRINRTAGRFFVRDTEVQLTPREYALLDYLLARPDELCTRDEILAGVWGINFDTGTNMVDVYMHFIRRKLEAHRAAGMIQTVRGRGYRLSADTDVPD